MPQSRSHLTPGERIQGGMSSSELLLELRRRIIRPRDRRRETWDDWDSLDSRGDWPDEG